MADEVHPALPRLSVFKFKLAALVSPVDRSNHVQTLECLHLKVHFCNKTSSDTISKFIVCLVLLKIIEQFFKIIPITK